MLDLTNARHNKNEIADRRSEVTRLLMLESENIKNGTVSSMSTRDLMLMLQLYDRIFFGNRFKDSFKGKLKFSLSRRMTKSAGKTLCPRNIRKIRPEELILEIRIGVDFFFHYGLVDGSKTVCGVRTNSSLEALQLVFEHELCHVIEFLIFQVSNCKADRFKTIAANLFGHTESYHKLPTHSQIASQRLGLNAGDTVSFAFEGKRLKGMLYRINKRAVVMVRDEKGAFTDKQGNRYTKYYVPLTQLM